MAISDTHCESLRCAVSEMEFVYDECLREGITDVLHAGNLFDGPGNRGFKGHNLEVRPDCQTVYQALRYVSESYPYREGVTTHFISSSTCHEGWEYRVSSINMGRCLAEGVSFSTIGVEGEELVTIPPRPDLHYLDLDMADILCGPEGKTRIKLFHPGGGSAYAISYRAQKWAESLQGGTKPNMAIMGHFHKSGYLRIRDIGMLLPGCLEWQTNYMQKKIVDAHVAAWLVELDVDAGGSIRGTRLKEYPFYREPERFVSSPLGGRGSSGLELLFPKEGPGV